jgi:hypothetical protein
MKLSHVIANCFMALVAVAAVAAQMTLLTGTVGA